VWRLALNRKRPCDPDALGILLRLVSAILLELFEQI
jgi:hypothetical protein